MRNHTVLSRSAMLALRKNTEQLPMRWRHELGHGMKDLRCPVAGKEGKRVTSSSDHLNRPWENKSRYPDTMGYNSYPRLSPSQELTDFFS